MFEGPQRLEIKEAANANAKTQEGQPKRQAYRPPHARGEPAANNVKVRLKACYLLLMVLRLLNGFKVF